MWYHLALGSTQQAQVSFRNYVLFRVTRDAIPKVPFSPPRFPYPTRDRRDCLSPKLLSPVWDDGQKNYLMMPFAIIAMQCW